MDSVIVKVSSPTAFPCSVISIQDIQCPVYDLDNNVAFIGMYQTMTKKAAITVQRKDFTNNGFYVVVVVKTEDEACGGALPYYPINPDTPVDHGSRQKTLEVLVSPATSRNTYIRGMLFCCGVFLSIYLLALFTYCWEKWRKKKGAGLLSSVGSLNDETASLLGKPPLGQRYDGCSYGSLGESSSVASPEDATDSLVSSGEVTYSYTGQEQFKRRSVCASLRPLNAAHRDRSLENLASRPRLESLSSVEEDDYDTLTDIESDKNIIRTKKFLCVADLARKDKRVMRKKYQIYF
ncbi:SID1 transmembrane family member 2-like, partial [Ascaphus truei]|uniref:SID1 transmembrane family member 2-like n=1 Tax=Ascaphus truei TaxID=8439 RepID=UPI003F5A4F47